MLNPELRWYGKSGQISSQGSSDLILSRTQGTCDSVDLVTGLCGRFLHILVALKNKTML